ncbi:MAG: EI24 domain-containing protein [Comamonadaceae bacterium]|nr:EI24 domain-containing protein [Comamonadaceae bacterium]
MTLLLDSFWRAAAYCMHPRVIALSFLPLVIMVALALGLGYFYWDPALEWVRVTLESSAWITRLWGWLEGLGAGNLKTVLAPLIVIFAVTPVIVLVALLIVAALMTPALVALVAERRFPIWSASAAARCCSVCCGRRAPPCWPSWPSGVPALWLVPPLILVLPPLIWGWLTYRVMSFDVLADTPAKPSGCHPPRAPRLAAGHWHPDGLSGRRAQCGLGVGDAVCGCVRHPGAGGDLDLHAGVCVLVAVVCPLRPGRAGKTARHAGYPACARLHPGAASIGG